TTCRVEFLAGEPQNMTVAERDVLVARGLSGIRLSCQILCDHDMTVKAISRLEGSGRKDAGHMPAAEVTPPHVWVTKRSEEHTSELQSSCNLVCRLLLEKKNNNFIIILR